MHPLFSSYLRSHEGTVPEACQRAFVDVLGGLANNLAPRQFHEQNIIFPFQDANLHVALTLAERLSMDSDFAAIAQFLGLYALRSRNFGEGSRLYGRLAEHWKARGNFRGESSAYHQLGRIAEEVQEPTTARNWYLKSLAIAEEHGNTQGAAGSYHQLGLLAEAQWDFATARDWFSKSLAISEAEGFNQYAAGTYHHLGLIAQDEGNRGAAREWYLKSITIKERLLSLA